MFTHMTPEERLFKEAMELEKDFYTYEEISEAARAVAEEYEHD